nr:hypothetical protein [Tanacetum cinerariifolium]GEZ65035.1 hypothetical protein [Tanacetum cinerariifolium]
VDDQGMDVYFLKLVAYCIKGFQKLTDDLHNLVASLFARLAESYSVVKDKVGCLLQLYGYSFSEKKLLCKNLSLILTNTFKDTSDELKDDPDSVNLPPIEEFLFTDISNSSQDTSMNNTKQAVNIVEAYFILSLITKEKTNVVVLFSSQDRVSLGACSIENSHFLKRSMLQNYKREKMVIDFVKRCEEAQLKFPIPSIVSMINQWVLVTLDSLLEATEAVVHLLKFVLELQACLNNEKNVSNKMQCILREIKLQQTLDKNNCRTDARLNRSRELIESGKKILENGVVGLKDCIDYISKTDLSDKSYEAREYLP